MKSSSAVSNKSAILKEKVRKLQAGIAKKHELIKHLRFRIGKLETPDLGKGAAAPRKPRKHHDKKQGGKK